MTNKNIFVIIVKVAAIYLIIQGLSQIYFVASFFTLDAGSRAVSFVNLGTIIFYFVLAIILFALANPIGNNLAGKDRDTKVDISITANELQALVFFAIGIFLVVTSLTGLASSLGQAIANKVQIAQQGALPDFGGAFDTRFWGELTGSSLKLILGIYLTFGFRGLSNFFKKIREA